MQRRVHELEFANQDLALRNAVLEASERAQREDAMRAREERAVAEKKLRRARRVMRDLLDERLVRRRTWRTCCSFPFVSFGSGCR
jgi:hypothetical protein